MNFYISKEILAKYGDDDDLIVGLIKVITWKNPIDISVSDLIFPKSRKSKSSKSQDATETTSTPTSTASAPVTPLTKEPKFFPLTRTIPTAPRPGAVAMAMMGASCCASMARLSRKKPAIRRWRVFNAYFRS